VTSITGVYRASALYRNYGRTLIAVTTWTGGCTLGALRFFCTMDICTMSQHVVGGTAPFWVIRSHASGIFHEDAAHEWANDSDCIASGPDDPAKRGGTDSSVPRPSGPSAAERPSLQKGPCGTGSGQPAGSCSHCLRGVRKRGGAHLPGSSSSVWPPMRGSLREHRASGHLVGRLSPPL
jgi:hypothetical protein